MDGAHLYSSIRPLLDSSRTKSQQAPNNHHTRLHHDGENAKQVQGENCPVSNWKTQNKAEGSHETSGHEGGMGIIETFITLQ